MKIATAFLVAVTVFASVFLESSAAPNPFFGYMASKAGAGVTELGNIAGNFINGAGKVVDKVVVKAGETAEVVVKKGVKDIGTVLQFVGKILTDLEATLGEVTEAAAALGDEIGENLKLLVSEIENNFKQLIELFGKLLKALDEGAVDSVKELEGCIKIKAAKLKAAVAGVIKYLDKISEKAGENVFGILKGALVKVNEAVEVILSKVAEAGKSKTTDVVDGAKKLNEQDLEEYVEKEIKTCEEALAALEKLVEDILATATDVEKEIITIVVEWLKKFVPYVSGIHENLREAVKVNDPEFHKKLIENIEETVEETKAQVNEMIKTQSDVIKEALEKYILETIVAEAVKLIEVLKNQSE